MKKAPFQKLPYKAVEESTVLLVLVVAVVQELRMLWKRTLVVRSPCFISMCLKAKYENGFS